MQRVLGLLMKASEQRTDTSESYVQTQPIENQEAITENTEKEVKRDIEEEVTSERQSWLENMFKKTKEMVRSRA